MSIYATRWAADEDTHPPIAYRGSHRYPNPDDRREWDAVLLCQIPAHCIPGADGDEDGPPAPYLRLAVHGVEGDAAVVLDREQVQAMYRELEDWHADTSPEVDL